MIQVRNATEHDALLPADPKDSSFAGFFGNSGIFSLATGHASSDHGFGDVIQIFQEKKHTMGETWYRGQSSTVAPLKAGAEIHDFGDGLYLTSSKEVAELYAKTRVAHGGGQPQVLSINLERSELGRVLDLNKDSRWQKFLQTPQIPNQPKTTPQHLIRVANENYSRLFEAFASKNKIRISDYDAVIGPEFVRGGSQLCILHRNSEPSTLAKQVRSRLKPIGSTGNAGTLPVMTVPGRNLALQSRAHGILRNQAAIALLGQLLGAAIQGLGDIGIARSVQRELTTTYAEAIRQILARGDGVLVIISMQEWEQPDFNGMRARSLLGVFVEGGSTPESAIATWREVPRFRRAPAKGWRSFEQYAWIDPAR